MAKRKATPPRLSNPEQETALQQAKERAIQNSLPRPSSEEAKAFPNLLWLICPSVMADPKHRGEGEPRMVLREPLFMLSWDRGAGQWKWQVSDKTFGISTYGPVNQLHDLFTDIETQLVNKTANVKELDIT